MLKNISVKFGALNCLLCIFIVLLHSDCSFAIENNMVYTVFRFIGTLCDAAVPLFFFLSAFWFYASLSDIENDFPQKIIKRFFSLIIPYLCFSAIYIIVNTIISKTGWKEYSTYSFLEMPVVISLKIWLLAKCDSAIWFIRPLVILQFISLPFYVLIKKHIAVGPACGAIGIIVNIILSEKYGNSMYWLPIFILGIWSAVYMDVWYNKVLMKIEQFKIAGGWVLFIILLVWIGTICIDRGDVIYYIYRNIGALMLLLSFWSIYPSKETILNRANKYSFFLFMLHYPIVFWLKEILVNKVSTHRQIDGLAVAVIYLITVIGTIVIVGILYELIRVFAPKVHMVLNGNRKIIK